jgi:hypothetical protein
MFKAVRISVLLLVLLFVAVNTWLTQARSTDWNNSLWVKIYPINADGTVEVDAYIDDLAVSDFTGIETFLQRETERYRPGLDRPVRIELGERVDAQPPALPDSPNALSVMKWSLRMRWWAAAIGDDQDDISPDVRIFVRYHRPDHSMTLENSVGLQKGMVGVVNGFASRRQRGRNNVVIAHEFLHTLGATDKYSPVNGHPLAPHGLAEPARDPLYPQRFAEIMGGRIALAEDDSVIPRNLDLAVIGRLTASEIRLID